MKDFVLRQDDKIIIGAYNLTFNTRSDFAYRTYTLCHGYFMRRENWKMIIENQEHHIFSNYFKEQVKKDYELHILCRIKPLKAAKMKKWMARADFRATLRVVSNNGIEFEPVNLDEHHSSDED
jgi:hypothetical protein